MQEKMQKLKRDSSQKEGSESASISLLGMCLIDSFSNFIQGIYYGLLLLSLSVVSDSLRPHGL